MEHKQTMGGYMSLHQVASFSSLTECASGIGNAA